MVMKCDAFEKLGERTFSRPFGRTDRREKLQRLRYWT